MHLLYKTFVPCTCESIDCIDLFAIWLHRFHHHQSNRNSSTQLGHLTFETQSTGKVCYRFVPSFSKALSFHCISLPLPIYIFKFSTIYFWKVLKCATFKLYIEKCLNFKLKFN